MSNHYPRLMQCVCGITIEDYGSSRVEWFSGKPHSCRDSAFAWIDSLASDALDGDVDSDHLVAEAVNVWLRA